MKKIGFIDYFLDEWHANNYPEMIKKETNGEFEVAYAYGKIDAPNGMTNKEWAEKYNIQLLDSIDEVVEKSDFLVVLSPDHPQMHEELADLPLKSGKHTYIDKTFALDKATAIRIFEKADANGTKCYSTSALRFASEWENFDKKDIDRLYSEGPEDFENCAIHQIEPIVMLMESRAKRLMFLGTEAHPEMIIEFSDGRMAHMYHRTDENCTFAMTAVDKANKSKSYQVNSDFFGTFIKNLIEFFRTGNVPVSHEQTIDVMGIIEVANKAMAKPFEWFDI